MRVIRIGIAISQPEPVLVRRPDTSVETSATWELWEFLQESGWQATVRPRLSRDMRPFTRSDDAERVFHIDPSGYPPGRA